MLAQRPLAASSLDIDALLEFSRLLNESEEAAFIYNNVLLSLMGKLGLGRAAVALAEGNGRFRVEYAKGGAGALRGLQITWGEQCRRGLLGLEYLEEPEDRRRLADAKIEHLMPVCFGQSTFAIALLGTPLAATGFDADEESYTLLVGVIAAMALEGTRIRGSLYQVNRSLESRVHRLRSLFEAGREFTSLLHRDAILRLLGLTLMGEMAIARFAVVLCGSDGDGKGYDEVVNRFRKDLPHDALDELSGAGVVILSPDDEFHPLRGAMYAIGIRASIPMEAQGKVRGLLFIGERLQNRTIDDEDGEYLALLANLAMSALENARLLEEMIEKERLEEDLKIAWEIQRGLLPKSLPVLAGFEIAAETIPARQVGGDCYDVIDLGGGRLLLSIADVSGKGTPASLLMANVQAALRALARIDIPLSDLVARINDVIYENTSVDKFITGFFGILDSREGTFSYVNAGHNPPYLFSQSGIDSLDAGGLILGVMPTMLPYETGAVSMAPGDLLVLYTDGVSEALNPDREEYGEERLQALFRDDYAIPATQALARARADLLAFADGAQQSDDITILALHRTAGQGR